MHWRRALLPRHFEVARIRGETPSRKEFDKRMASLTPPYYGPDVPVTSPGTPLPQPLLRRLAHDGRYEEGFRAAFGSATPTTANMVGAMKSYMLSLRTGENRYDRYLAGEPDALTVTLALGVCLAAWVVPAASRIVSVVHVDTLLPKFPLIVLLDKSSGAPLSAVMTLESLPLSTADDRPPARMQIITLAQ